MLYTARVERGAASVWPGRQSACERESCAQGAPHSRGRRRRGKIKSEAFDHSRAPRAEQGEATNGESTSCNLMDSLMGDERRRH